MKLECLGRGKTRCAADCFGCPVRVAAIELGKTTDVGNCIVDGLAGFSVSRFAGVVLGTLSVRAGAGEQG
jgi:hypothetical protein